jgi:hypothetical protein
MSEVIDPQAAQVDRRERLRSRLAELSTVLVEKYGVHPEDLDMVREEMMDTIDRLAQAHMPFPFTEKETMAILKAPITESWLHPITNLAHKLLMHHQVINEPYMIGGVDKEEGAKESKGVVCMCYYATVRVKPDEIRVYSNWDAGGMCAETIEHLVAVHPTPDYMAALLPQLEQIADTQMRQPIQTYEEPLKVRLKLPEPECAGPGL